jgi:hypothetical protein
LPPPRGRLASKEAATRQATEYYYIKKDFKFEI